MQASTWYCTTCGAANDTATSHCFACSQPYTEDTAGTSVASILQGRYRLLSQVGIGGFGVVYKAIDTQSTNQTVAIKQINLRGLTPQKVIEATDAFNREVQHLTPLQHPNLPRIYNHFTDPDHWYLVMEFIEGETLERYLETRQLQHMYTGKQTLLPLDEIFPLACQLCDVLTYLHTCHPPIIFRDIKPANIMRTAKGHLYLIDFGIARHFKPGQARDTTPLGSPGYAAPEQYGKAQTTPRADIYSLGALLHHLLTGIDPAETLFDFAPLPQIAGAEMQVQKLETLVRRMVNVDSKQRPVSAVEVKTELQSIARLAAAAAPRIWYPPQGQTPSPSLYQDTFSSLSARQQQVQAQSQKSKGTSRRKFITLTVVGGTTAIAGTVIGGSILVNFFSSFGSLGWHREIATSSAYPPVIRQPTRSVIVWSPDGKQFAFIPPYAAFAEVHSIDSNGEVIYRAQLQDEYYSAPLSTLAWSPDGSRLATASIDGGINIWFIKSNFGPIDYFPLKYPVNSRAINSLVWSPDSKLIATSDSMQRLDIFDLQSSQIIFQREQMPTFNTNLFSWSPDSNHIVISNNLPDMRPTLPVLQIWDIKAGKTALTFTMSPGGDMVKAAWSPDGKTIATLSQSGNLYVWNAANGSFIAIHYLPINVSFDLLWSPDSQSIALKSEQGNLQIWHIQSNLAKNYYLKPGPTRAWIWLQDGRIALVDETKTLQYINTLDS